MTSKAPSLNLTPVHNLLWWVLTTVSHSSHRRLSQQAVWCPWALNHCPISANHRPRIAELPQHQDSSDPPDPPAQRCKPDIPILPSGERRTNDRCQGERLRSDWTSVLSEIGLKTFINHLSCAKCWGYKYRSKASPLKSLHSNRERLSTREWGWSKGVTRIANGAIRDKMGLHFTRAVAILIGLNLKEWGEHRQRGKTGFKSCLWHLIAMWPWAGHLISLETFLSFPL